MRRSRVRSAKTLVKLSLACAIAATLLLAVVPVWAGWDVNVYFRHAGSGQDPRSGTPTANSVIDGSHKVIVDATSSSSLYAFQVEIQSVNPSYGLADSARVHRRYSPGSRQSDRITIEWDTRSLTPYNGQYQITARAWSQVELQESKLTGIMVDNKPQTPAGVKVRMQGELPVVSWLPNAEPDLMHYVVYRSKESRAFSAVGTTASTSYKDTNAPTETSMRYLVVAVRRSFAQSSGRIESGPSAPTQAVSITVPEEEDQADKTHATIIPEPVRAPVAAVSVGSSETSQVQTHQETEFAPVLPYESDYEPADETSTQESPEEPESIVVTPRGPRAVLTLASISQEPRSVDPMPFMAAALVLIGMSLHLLRAAWTLARS